jgi:hypothetical protein
VLWRGYRPVFLRRRISFEEIQPVTKATAKQRARLHRPWRASVQAVIPFYRTPRKKLAGEHFDSIELAFVTRSV